jgi:hypothetical protein
MNNAKNSKKGPLTSLAVKVLEGWFLVEMKAGDQGYKMRYSNQKIADPL